MVAGIHGKCWEIACYYYFQKDYCHAWQLPPWLENYNLIKIIVPYNSTHTEMPRGAKDRSGLGVRNIVRPPLSVFDFPC